MAYSVLIVDDSSFFQQRLKDIVNSSAELKVIGIASNGQEAIEMADKLKPDVITMDYEMPMLDGVSALKAILAKRYVPIVMLSSLTFEGARITLDALAAGAVDFIPKNFSEISQNSSTLKQKIHTTLITFARQFKVKMAEQCHSHAPNTVIPSARSASFSATPIANNPTYQASTRRLSSPFVKPENSDGDLDKHYSSSAVLRSSSTVLSATDNKNNDNATNAYLPRNATILVIGASTGGPVAVNKVLESLPAGFALPIVVIQHMPANFTKALAERLDRVCALRAKEAENGDKLMPGLVLVAPGGQQLMFDPHNKGTVKILPGDDRVSYKPSVDIALASVANAFGQQAFAIILTGMGADGCEGAKILKQKGGVLWSQNKDSCVVYGMPKAVADAGLSDCVLTLEAMGTALNRRR